ncbi:MAG TPA: hypothetical protein VKU41_19665 [Polyangiaceae bacterium]|nr:hypothetical protein [Polyangiaceae bacterium]
MASPDLAGVLQALFDAERAARLAHDELVAADPARLLPVLEKATRDALSLDARNEDESSLRLVRLAAVLGEMQGPQVVDLLIDVLGSDEPEARHAAGEALSGLAVDRFKEVALGMERAIERLAPDSPALAELPYLLVGVPEPGVAKLLAKFLAHRNADAVASSIEAVVEIGDRSMLSLLDPLASDTRRVELDDESGTNGDAAIGELVAEAREILLKGASA